MTWGDLKKRIEQQNVNDKDTVVFIDIGDVYDDMDGPTVKLNDRGQVEIYS